MRLGDETGREIMRSDHPEDPITSKYSHLAE